MRGVLSLRDRRKNYWAGIITASAHDPKALWSKVDALLKPPKTTLLSACLSQAIDIALDS